MGGTQSGGRIHGGSREFLMTLGIVGVALCALVAMGADGWVGVAAVWLCVSMCMLAVAAGLIDETSGAFPVIRALALTWFVVGAALSGYLALVTSDPQLRVVAGLAAGGLCSFVLYALTRRRPAWAKLSLGLMFAFITLLVVYEIHCAICDMGGIVVSSG